MPKHVLVVDDDKLLRQSLALSLKQAGYHVSTAETAEDGLALARRGRPDLVVLDIGLPGMDGLAAIHHFQEANIPVIFVTARKRGIEEIMGLELGAEDYITKPFDMDVLLARVKAVLRRYARAEQQTSEAAALTVGDLYIDPNAHTVTVGGEPVELSRREFDVLYTLSENAERIVSSGDLLTRVWGAEYSGQPQVVYVHIRWLRQKLEEDPANPERIITVRNVGYKLIPRNP